LDDAEKYYHRFFHELPYNHIHAVQCYDQLGNIARKKGYYEWSLKWHNQSLSIKKQTLKLGHHSIVYSHSNIGRVYQAKKCYARAWESFKKEWTIYEERYVRNNPHMAKCLESCGNILTEERQYSMALKYYGKALSILNNCLSDNHSDLGYLIKK
jgi:tetratricopeptide (TPR) repeat protein